MATGTRNSSDSDAGKKVDADVDKRAKAAEARQKAAADRDESSIVGDAAPPSRAVTSAERARAVAVEAQKSGTPLTTDNATATDTAAVAVDVKPAAPFADADPLAHAVVLLPRSRQNGTWEGPEYSVGTDDEAFKGSAELMVYNLFGGPDADVRLYVAVQGRRDASEPWAEIGRFGDGAIDRSGSYTIGGVDHFGDVRCVGSVIGTAGGHAAEIEVSISRG